MTQFDEASLLPCPREECCGAAVVGHSVSELGNPNAEILGFFFECFECGYSTQVYETQEQAVLEWNGC